MTFLEWLFWASIVYLIVSFTTAWFIVRIIGFIAESEQDEK